MLRKCSKVAMNQNKSIVIISLNLLGFFFRDGCLSSGEPNQKCLIVSLDII